MESPNPQDWTKAHSNIFWAEIAPYEHVVQIYESDKVFLETLSGFVKDGLNSGECVLVIATASHLQSLNTRLRQDGYDILDLSARNLYIPLDAEVMLTKFMVNDWPDERLFMDSVSDLIADAEKSDRRVRAFGEMVAVLWANGHVGATVRLEQLWNKFCETRAFCLFCAYPQSGFSQDAAESILHICSAHSKMIAAGQGPGINDIYYKAIAS
jgi:hypothetical protein